jgi:membrane protein YdbS with pleckstrin-like domain
MNAENASNETNQEGPRRWFSPALLLLAVLLIGGGVAGILRVSYIMRPSWFIVIAPCVAVVAGTVLLLVPLLRRLSQEPD